MRFAVAVHGAATSFNAESAKNAENVNLWIYDNREQSAVGKVAPCLASSASSAVDAVAVRFAWTSREVRGLCLWGAEGEAILWRDGGVWPGNSGNSTGNSQTL